jgi:hypothetical protein
MKKQFFSVVMLMSIIAAPVHASELQSAKEVLGLHNALGVSVSVVDLKAQIRALLPLIEQGNQEAAQLLLSFFEKVQKPVFENQVYWYNQVINTLKNARLVDLNNIVTNVSPIGRLVQFCMKKNGMKIASLPLPTQETVVEETAKTWGDTVLSWKDSVGSGLLNWFSQKATNGVQNTPGAFVYGYEKVASMNPRAMFNAPKETAMAALEAIQEKPVATGVGAVVGAYVGNKIGGIRQGENAGWLRTGFKTLSTLTGAVTGAFAGNVFADEDASVVAGISLGVGYLGYKGIAALSGKKSKPLATEWKKEIKNTVANEPCTDIIALPYSGNLDEYNAFFADKKEHHKKMETVLAELTEKKAAAKDFVEKYVIYRGENEEDKMTTRLHMHDADSTLLLTTKEAIEASMNDFHFVKYSSFRDGNKDFEFVAAENDSRVAEFKKLAPVYQEAIKKTLIASRMFRRIDRTQANKFNKDVYTPYKQQLKALVK